jgi:hypothetical protein
MNIGLFDGCFQNSASVSLGGMNKGSPKNIAWQRGQHLPVTFYTDTNLERVWERDDKERSVALLVEPPSLSDTHYRIASDLYDTYHYILTHQVDYIGGFDKIFWYPCGGTWLAPEQIGLKHVKTKPCSMILSAKRGAAGHKLRHAIAPEARRSKMVELFGVGAGQPIDDKLDALAPYHFSIVVESCRERGYFSEKLLDCLLVGTIPIYWGCPDLPQYGFDPRGIIAFENAGQISDILSDLETFRLPVCLEAMVNNFHKAQEYVCAEDWIFDKLPFLFA